MAVMISLPGGFACTFRETNCSLTDPGMYIHV